MGPELEVKPKSGAAMEVSVAKDGTTHHDVVVDDKFMPCVSNYKDNILEMEETLVGQTTASNKRENAELNRTGGTSPRKIHFSSHTKELCCLFYQIVDKGLSPAII